MCCLVDMYLYSNKLSTIATISSLMISDLFPACSFCNNNFNQSESSLGSDDKILVFETPEAEIIKFGNLCIFIRVLSQLGF